MYRYKSNTGPKMFIGFKFPLGFYINIMKGYITKKKQRENKKNLNKKQTK